MKTATPTDIPPLRPAQARLARPFVELVSALRPDEILDVVIVGSGYGGSVAAEALAGRVKKVHGKDEPLTVCVLERGKEYLPGEFPARFEELPGHLRRTDGATGTVTGDPGGLFDVRMGADVVALVANGVGGGSLINAGVLLEPDPQDFLPGSEARALVASLQEGGWYDKALVALGGGFRKDPQAPLEPNTIDRHEHAGRLGKTRALGTLGTGMTRPPISVSMDTRANDADVQLSACTLCGDCMTGCNIGAKDSLDANLLEKAVRAGARVYTGASVLWLRQQAAKAVKTGTPADARRWAQRESHWELFVAHTSPALQQREEAPVRIRARHVILAAGTLGSTEILLRSRSDKLVFSPQLGQGFSCNGDNLSAVYGMARPTQGCADEDTPLTGRFVGPTITGSLRMHSEDPDAETTPVRRSFQVQEFSVPGPMKRVFEEIVTTGQLLQTLPRADLGAHGSEPHGALDPFAVDDEAIGRTLVVGTIGHDDAKGVIHLPSPQPTRKMPVVQGTVGIHWPDARDAVRLDDAHERIAQAVAALRSGDDVEPSLVPNPMWRLLPNELAALVSQPRGPVLTVHPLGGCRIGPRRLNTPNQAAGVVDAYGRVRNFAPSQDRVFRSLVVLDGAIIPGSLGVNPSLTIAATAMRAMAGLTKSWGFTKPSSPPGARVIWARRRAPVPAVPRLPDLPDAPAGRGTTEVQIVERLRGDVPLLFGGRTQDCVVELTLAYRPLPIGQLMGPLQRRMVVNPDDPVTRLRIFSKQDWEDRHLKLESDLLRRPWLIFEARLGGTLAVLGREPSGPWRRALRSVPAWFVNRGVREIWQRLFGPDDSPPKAGSKARDKAPGDDVWGYVLSLLRMGTRAGEVRRLDYDLAIAEVLPTPAGLAAPRLQVGDVIRASKRLTYGRRANPWRQLTELTVDEFPAMDAMMPAVLTLDGSFLAGQGFPLLRITRQRNGATALADLASFGLYMTRLLAAIHLWTFRKPDTQPRRLPDRLPGPVAGLVEPEVTELAVDRYPNSEKPVVIRLTRYRQVVGPKQKAGPPLVLIHGYSASGNTFTHPSLPTPAARYFCEQGRDVWVVDLRTSPGLPSCTYPWSMEQVGLIDIPAALLHVRSVTGQPVDVLAHCIGCVMLSMALLTDAREVRNNDVELGPDTWLTTRHLGVLKAFNNQHPGQAHPVIRKLILSQKGPVLRYTDANILRAFVLQSVRRWLMRDDFHFQPSNDPGVAEQLMDRLLASMPYPDADYDVENPFWPCALVPWTATRHRMDALYGRAFDAANMSPETLDAINDIFGPISMDTVAQTIHFARANAITNQAGRGEFVTLGRLQERWRGVDTYAIHGGNNGLVDVLTQHLLSDQLRRAGVPFSEPAAHKSVYDTLGHQDVLMGTRSREVFEDLEEFLKRPVVLNDEAVKAGTTPTDDVEKAQQAAPKKPAPEPILCALPWIGPRFDIPRRLCNSVRIACLSDPKQGRGRLYLLPAWRWTDAQGQFNHQVIAEPSAVGTAPRACSSARWMKVRPPIEELRRLTTGLDRQPAPAPNATPGWLAVVVYPLSEALARWSVSPVPEAPANRSTSGQMQRMPRRAGAPKPGVVSTPVIDPGGSPLLTQSHLAFESKVLARLRSPDIDEEVRELFLRVLSAADAWLSEMRPEDIELAFVTLKHVEAAQDLNDPDKFDLPFSFAFGSCQYPIGLLDTMVAQRTLQQMATLADTPDQRIDFALFVGDQIYADATAGLIDPTRRDELFDAPNDKALRAAGMRAVLRRVPARMLLDDHEIRDNWEPMPDKVAHRRPEASQRNRQLRSYGLRAWAKYQLMRPLPSRRRRLAGAGDLEFTAGGVLFHFLDTRSGRSARGSTVRPESRRLINPAQWEGLKRWLTSHRNELKFIVTPSILLPRRREVAGDTRSAWDTAAQARAAHSDAWDGFPVSMQELFDFLVTEQIRNTVFLSGDEHHAMVTRAVLQPTDACRPCVEILSVHSSGLYAPFPFANGQPGDLVPTDNFTLETVKVSAHTQFAPAGDGFARITVGPGGGLADVQIEWVKSGGQVGRPPGPTGAGVSSGPCSGCGSDDPEHPPPAATTPT